MTFTRENIILHHILLFNQKQSKLKLLLALFKLAHEYLNKGYLCVNFQDERL